MYKEFQNQYESKPQFNEIQTWATVLNKAASLKDIHEKSTADEVKKTIDVLDDLVVKFFPHMSKRNDQSLVQRPEWLDD